MTLRDKYIFLQQATSDFKDIGAVFPTGSSAARALTSEIRRRSGAQKIMEVGCGTGPVTEEILKSMGPDDRLTICDLNESFLNYVKNRFSNEPKFKKKAHQVDFYLGDITEFEAAQQFDIIISSLPFNSMPIEILDKVITHYRSLLKPDGSLSYIEYAFIRDIRDAILPTNKIEQYEASNKLLRKIIEAHEYRAELIRSNIPPTYVRSLRFQESRVADANTVKPDPKQRRVKAGSLSFSSDGLPIFLTLLSAGALWKATGKKGWALPFALAGVAAWFHRDPNREIATDRNLCLAAADGKVVGIREVRHPRMGGGQEWIVIETEPSFNNIHVNRSPVCGRVVDRWSEPKGYSPSNAVGIENHDSSYVALDTEHGPCVVVQRAQALAHKIFTWCQKGELLTQGERFGFARFNSRTDVYLPKGKASLLIQTGDEVVAGRTPIAKFLSASEPAK